MARSSNPTPQEPAKRTPLVMLVVGVAVIAGVYVLDRTKGQQPSRPPLPATPDGGLAAPAPPPPDPSMLPGASGPSGAPGQLTPEMMKALQASGGKDLPPELAKALGISGPSGAGQPAPPPRPADVPEFWPQDIPTPPGGKLQTQIALDTRASLVYQTAKPTTETVAHYSTEMPKLGWEQQEKVASAEGTRFTFTKGERTVTVGVANPRDGESAVFLTVLVKEPPAGGPTGSAGAKGPGGPPPMMPPGAKGMPMMPPGAKGMPMMPPGARGMPMMPPGAKGMPMMPPAPPPPAR